MVPEPVSLPDDHRLAYLLNPGGDAARVQSLAQPLTEAEADRLLTEYAPPDVAAILSQMANWAKLLTSAVSANLTARNWLDKRAKEAAALAAQPATPNRSLQINRPADRMTVAAETQQLIAARAAAGVYKDW